MAKKRRGRTRLTGHVAVVRAARIAAKTALERLRNAITETKKTLENLLEEERQFRAELFGGETEAAAPRGRRGRKPGRKPGRPKGPPKAEKYFEKLPATFGIEDVRKLAGRAAGISLAQWSRAKRIKKTGDKYQKVA